jgi:flagellar biosynthesis chaperone FliJ
MQAAIQSPQKSVLLVSVLLGGVIFTSCASAPQSSNQGVPPSLADTVAAPMAAKNLAQKLEAAPVPRGRPQLIKKAAMTVIVNSVAQSIDAVSQIISKQQGDLIKLSEQQPTKENARHRASIQLRIPQNLLEPTLSELSKLGTVGNRNITAEDVGDRLVDFQARLTNLRKTEANLQKIMDRAGSIRDVLSVAQELSNIRQSIEQIDAQLKNLQNQVAYSSITLNLEAAVSGTNPQRALGSQVQQTWNNSTNSFGTLTVRLLKLGIWLMVYSPYILILAAGIYGFNRWRRTHSPRLIQTPESANSD